MGIVITPIFQNGETESWSNQQWIINHPIPKSSLISSLHTKQAPGSRQQGKQISHSYPSNSILMSPFSKKSNGYKIAKRIKLNSSSWHSSFFKKPNPSYLGIILDSERVANIIGRVPYKPSSAPPTLPSYETMAHY